jgi:hypothetical protein
MLFDHYPEDDEKRCNILIVSGNWGLNFEIEQNLKAAWRDKYKLTILTEDITKEVKNEKSVENAIDGLSQRSIYGAVFINTDSDSGQNPLLEYFCTRFIETAANPFNVVNFHSKNKPANQFLINHHRVKSNRLNFSTELTAEKISWWLRHNIWRASQNIHIA